MFLFEYENQNKVINVALNLPSNSSNWKKQKLIKVMNRTFNVPNTTKYGSKWFLNPNTWNDRMKAANQNNSGSIANNLKTVQTFSKLVETFKNKIVDKSEPQKQDIIQNFEDEIMMIKKG